MNLSPLKVEEIRPSDYKGVAETVLWFQEQILEIIQETENDFGETCRVNGLLTRRLIEMYYRVRNMIVQMTSTEFES